MIPNTSMPWYDDHKWVQRLRGCYSASSGHHPLIYSFPLEDALYQLLLKAKLDHSEDSLDYLHILWDCYHREHPEFNISIDTLIEEGWIDSVCGRWSLVDHCSAEHLNGAEDSDSRSILEFLIWLSAQISEYCSPVYIENWAQELDQLRGWYPTLPDTDWFIKEQILHTDGTHFCHIGYGPRSANFYTALARLWLTADTPEKKAKWAEFAHQLGATVRLLSYLPAKGFSEVISLLAERFLAGVIPDAAVENRRMNRVYMFERRKFQSTANLPHILSEDDCINNLTKAEHRDLEFSTLGWHRNILRFFELSAMIDYISQVPTGLRQSVLSRIQNLHEIGFLSRVQPAEAEAVIYLLRYPQTQFVSTQALIVLHNEQSHAGNQTAGDCLLAWLAFALRQSTFQKPEPIILTLLYLSKYAYCGTKANKPDDELLQAVLQVLSRYQIQRSQLLCRLSSQLVEKLDATKGITWCRIVQLVSQMAQIFSQTAPQNDELSLPLPILLDGLGQNLKRLLCVPFTDEANYIPSSLFTYSFWTELYTTSDDPDHEWMLDPILSWYRGTDPDTHQQFTVRSQFKLSLAWLAALKKRFPNDRKIHCAFREILCFVLEPAHQLLTIEWIEVTDGCPELAGAIRLLKSQGMDELLEHLCTLRSSELILLIQYAADESVRTLFLDKLQQRIKNGRNDALDLFGWTRLVQYILEQKIELLYDTCEQHLEDYLTRVGGEKFRYARTIGNPEYRMLSYIWLLRGDYEQLFKRGHPYMQAVARLEEGPYQDLKEAVCCWEKLSKHSQDPSTYQNLLLSYLRMLEKEPSSNEWSSIIQHIDALRLKIEEELLGSWPEDSQLQYTDELFYYFCLTGDSETLALQKASAAVHISEELLAKRITPEDVSLPSYPQIVTEQPVDQLVSALRQFHSMSLLQKSRCFFASHSQAVSSQTDLSLIL